MSEELRCVCGATFESEDALLDHENVCMEVLEDRSPVEGPVY